MVQKVFRFLVPIVLLPNLVSFLGYPPVQKALVNPSHIALAKLYNKGLISHILTQNVDDLHEKAFKKLRIVTPPVTALHGSLSTVQCLTCHELFSRESFQNFLIDLNPDWEILLELDQSLINTNPDGDVEYPISQKLGNLSYQNFRYPACSVCVDNNKNVLIDSEGAWQGGSDGIIKPSVTFFGENISSKIKETAESLSEQAGQLLIIGSSLATYSAFRIAKNFKTDSKNIAIVNWGGSVREESNLVTPGSGDLRIWYKSDDLLLNSLDILP